MNRTMWVCENGYPPNFSFSAIINRTNAWEPGERISNGDIFTMCLCVIGIVGNSLNLVLLSVKRCLRKLQSLEDNANLVLTALACSDLAFCLIALPFPVTNGLPYYVSEARVWFLRYRYFCHALINLCLMTSTYFVVILAIERYTAMYYPLKAKLLGKQCSIMAEILTVFAICLAATIPYFINNITVPCYSKTSGIILYELIPRWHRNAPLEIYMTKIWPILAIVLPLSILFFCNLRLIQGLRKVMSHRKYQVTLTLIAVVFLSIILVVPAEIVKLVNPYKTWGDRGYIIAYVVNALQTSNFAVNFFLYCTLDREYREICGRIFACDFKNFEHNTSGNNMPLVKSSRTRITYSANARHSRRIDL